VNTRKELKFYMMADRMMNRGHFNRDLKCVLKEFFAPDYIMQYLTAMRKMDYYSKKSGIYSKLLSFLNHLHYMRLGCKLGFSISPGVFGYGLVIPHYGTIVVGSGNSIGNYCVLHTSTCITAGAKKIGNSLYVSSGAKLLKSIELKDGVSIGANSVVNKSFNDAKILLVGLPATIKMCKNPWYTDDEKFKLRVEKCELLRKK